MSAPSIAHAHDFAVIGGGIVGLAVAHALAARYPGRSLLVLEKEAGLARHQTGHNSGVIHTGLYYRPGSARAQMCVEGAAALVAFCREHGIAHRICGKVVVAVGEAEVPRLEELHRRGQANGLQGLRRIGPPELRELEPHAAGVAALHVPGTGIVDYPGVALKLGELIGLAGGEIRTSAALLAARESEGAMRLETSAGQFSARQVINCAGLQADRVARLLGADPEIQIIPFRGEYYTLRPERDELVRALIYPVPDPAFPFLGVHFTRMIRGGVEAGPNAVLALRREGYRKSDVSAGDVLGYLTYGGFWRMAARYWRTGMGEVRRSLDKSAFTRALQRLIPELRDSDLVPGGSGVRATVVSPDGRLPDDFQFLHHGRALHVLNTPSPAGTAALAIGQQIATTAARVFAL